MNNNLSIIRNKEASKRLGVSLSQLNNWLNPASPYYRPDFPKRVKLGSYKSSPSGFLSSELDAYIQKLADNR